jgi:hypothetical protein
MPKCVILWGHLSMTSCDGDAQVYKETVIYKEICYNVICDIPTIDFNEILLGKILSKIISSVRFFQIIDLVSSGIHCR